MNDWFFVPIVYQTTAGEYYFEWERQFAIMREARELAKQVYIARALTGIPADHWIERMFMLVESLLIDTSSQLH